MYVDTNVFMLPACICGYRIFTNGSKEGNRVAAAVVHRDNTKCVRLLDTASIFRAELYALLLAIDVVRCTKERIL